MVTNEKIQIAIKRGKEYIENSGAADTGYAEYWYRTNISYWEKEDKKRIYINMRYGRNYKGRSKWQRGVSYYVCLNTHNIVDVSRDYNNAAENSIVYNVANIILENLK